jgi:membrane protease YdiL (CAAX protease family)
MREARSSSGVVADLLQVCGLNAPRPSTSHGVLDRHMLACWLVAWPVWLVMGWVAGTQLRPPGSAMAWLSLGCWQPLMEEVAFRGLLQGQLQKAWPQARLGPVSLANSLTTLGFAAAHLLHQSPVWAMLVVPPSLLMGHLRERFDSAWPAVALHAYYNLGFGLTAWLCGVR